MYPSFVVLYFFSFFFNDTATTEIYTLSLHDALPISDPEAALHHLERTQPEDHFDELGIWRHIELKKTIYRLPDEDPELAPWLSRLGEVAGEPDSIDMLLAEVEAQQADGGVRDPHQLE